MKLDSQLLDSLTEQAKASPRLRMSFDLRNGAEDNSQRVLNALEPGTMVPVHRHVASSETFIVLRGKLRETFYNDKGEVLETFVCQAGTPLFGCNIPKVSGILPRVWRVERSSSKPRMANMLLKQKRMSWITSPRMWKRKSMWR